MNQKPDLAQENEEHKLPAPKKPRSNKRALIIGIISILVTIGLGFLAIAFQDALMQYAAGYSLLGVLVISFLAGSLLSFTAVPVPYWALVIALPTALAPRWGLLAPFAVGLISALGATIGHMPTFMIGYSGKQFSESITSRLNPRLTRWYNRIINWSHKHGWIAVFLTSAVFNPIHLPMTIAIACFTTSNALLFDIADQEEDESSKVPSVPVLRGRNFAQCFSW